MSSEPGTTIFKNLCRNRNLRALPWSGLLSMTRPLQRSSTVPLETRSCTARRHIRHKRRGVPLREGTAGVRPSDDDDEDGTRLLACTTCFYLSCFLLSRMPGFLLGCISVLIADIALFMRCLADIVSASSDSSDRITSISCTVGILQLTSCMVNSKSVRPEHCSSTHFALRSPSTPSRLV